MEKNLPRTHTFGMHTNKSERREEKNFTTNHTNLYFDILYSFSKLSYLEV